MFTSLSSGTCTAQQVVSLPVLTQQPCGRSKSGMGESAVFGVAWEGVCDKGQRHVRNVESCTCEGLRKDKAATPGIPLGRRGDLCWQVRCVCPSKQECQCPFSY